MASVKKKKIKKLRRVHIWPSIVFFFLSLFMMGVGASFIYSLDLTAQMEKQIDQSVIEAENYSRLISDRLKKGDSLEESLDFLAEGGYNIEAMYALDEEKKATVGFGGFTCAAEDRVDMNIMILATLYRDKDSQRDMNYGFIPEPNIMTREWFVFENGENLNFDDTAFRYKKVVHSPYWIELPNLPNNSRVIMKKYFDYTRNDILWAFVPAVIAALLMFIPAVFMFINIIVNFSSQRRTTKLLFLDTVTGGNNWYYFVSKAGRTLQKRSNANRLYAVVDFSMAKYRNYSVFHGTEAGEQLLEQIDGFFKKRIKSGECIAHSQNAGFALLMKCSSKDECRERIDKWIAELPAYLEHCHAVFHAGICFVPPVSEGESKKSRKKIDITRLYNNAAAARAAISQSEVSGIEIFGDELLEAQIWEHRVEEMMDEALKNKEFQVYIQPKYNPVTEELAGGEALIRWISPTEGFIGPGKFIPIFEKNGFITKIDDFMISSVAALQSKWVSEGKKVVPISVNVSRIHFAMPDLAEHICSLVDEHGISHHLVEIELTESAFFDDKKMLLNTIRKLQELGFEVSMDDFGSGYSSLNSLKDMPLDVLKLDADFFRGENDGNRGEIVISEAIQLAKSLNMKIVAEGVEKKDQVDFLAGQGCDMIQGFYYAKPMPTDEFEGRMTVSED